MVVVVVLKPKENLFDVKIIFNLSVEGFVQGQLQDNFELVVTKMIVIAIIKNGDESFSILDCSRGPAGERPFPGQF